MTVNDPKQTMTKFMIRIFIFFCIYLSVVQAVPNDSKSISNSCMPNSEMKIAGIVLGEEMDSVYEKLGTPNNKRSKKVEVFLHPLEIITYPDVEIQMVTSNVPRVQRITCNTPNCGTPSGIKPGKSMVDVLQIVGFNVEENDFLDYRMGNKYFIPRCTGANELNDVEQVFGFEINDKDIITSIEMFWEPP